MQCNVPYNNMQQQRRRTEGDTLFVVMVAAGVDIRLLGLLEQVACLVGLMVMEGLTQRLAQACGDARPRV